MNARSSVISARIASRSRGARAGTLADSATEASNTVSTIVWIAGVGFISYMLLKHVAPGLLDSATATRNSVRRFKDAGPSAEERARDRSRADERIRERQEKALSKPRVFKNAGVEIYRPTRADRQPAQNLGVVDAEIVAD